MSDKQILEKAIHKAIDGGWKEAHGNTLHVLDDGTIVVVLKRKQGADYAYGTNTSLFNIIYQHDFAKALWGEEPIPPVVHGHEIPWWKMHLSQMVISDNPIEYLGKNI